MSAEIRLDPAGAVAAGLDLDGPGAREEVRALLLEYGVVVIPGLELDAAGVIEAARAVGEPLRHPPHPAYPDLPEIAPIANDDARGRVSFPYWHVDGLLRPDAPDITLFYAAEVPETGGETLFADARRAYDELGAGDRDLVDGLTAVFGTGTRCPLVRSHPVSGRRALAINSGATVGIEGVTRESAERLLVDLTTHLARRENVYVHRFTRGDLVIWDNWAVAHSATPTPLPPARRLMLRADVHAWPAAPGD